MLELLRIPRLAFQADATKVNKLATMTFPKQEKQNTNCRQRHVHKDTTYRYVRVPRTTMSLSRTAEQVWYAHYMSPSDQNSGRPHHQVYSLRISNTFRPTQTSKYPYTSDKSTQVYPAVHPESYTMLRSTTTLPAGQQPIQEITDQKKDSAITITTKTPSARTSALIIIDTQNEFLDPEGNFPISDLVRPSLLSNLAKLIPRFRSQGGHIIWVQAIYANRTAEPAAMAAQEKGDGIVGNNEWLTVATHVYHISCCEDESWGAEILPELWDLSADEDTVVLKTGYSAFNQSTALLEVLRRKKVKDAYFCGVASGTCVLATILDAVRLKEVSVHAVDDCMGWRRENTHVEAVRRYRELGVDVVNGEDVEIEN